MKSRLYDALNTSEYYQEYVTLYNKFKHISTSSIFIRYYKVNKNFSTYDDKLKAVENRYFGGLVYDIFDYTPTLNTDAMTNDSYLDDMREGRQYQGENSVITYTICQPSLNDIITFPYKPNNQEEIFRVKDINTTLAYNKDGMGLDVYRLGIEYANITKAELPELNIQSKYIYLLPKNKYIEDCKFKRILELVDIITDLLLKEYFNQYSELYENLNDNTNVLIYDLLSSNRELFHCPPIPFGIKYKCGLLSNGDINEPYKSLIAELVELLNSEKLSCS